MKHNIQIPLSIVVKTIPSGVLCVFSVGSVVIASACAVDATTASEHKQVNSVCATEKRMTVLTTTRRSRSRNADYEMK